MKKLKPWQVRIPAICSRCGKQFMAIRQLVMRGKGKFCTVKCSKLQTTEERQPSVSMGNGYRGVWIRSGRYRPEHVAVAEKALGHPLPDGAVVHHVNENTTDNRNGNLVICENNSYHRFLHRLLTIMRLGYDPHTNKQCWGKCRQVKPRTEFYKNRRNYDGLNQECKPCALERTGWHVKVNPRRKAGVA